MLDLVIYFKTFIIYPYEFKYYQLFKSKFLLSAITWDAETCHIFTNMFNLFL